MAVTFKKTPKAVTQTKAKTAPAKPKAEAPPGAAAIVKHASQLADLIIAQQPAIVAAKEPAKIVNKARAELLDLVSEEYADSESIIVTGETGKVKFSESSKVRVATDMKAIHKILGDAAFYKLASMSMKDIDDYLTPQQREQVLDSVPGSRTMTVIPNA